MATLMHGLSDILESLAAVLQRLLLSLQRFPLRLLCCVQINSTFCHAPTKVLLLLLMLLAVRLPLAVIRELVLGICLVLNMVLLPFSRAPALNLLLMLARLLVLIKVLAITSLLMFFLPSFLTMLLVLTRLLTLALLLHGLSDFQEPLAAVVQGVLTDQHGFTLCLLC